MYMYVCLPGGSVVGECEDDCDGDGDAVCDGDIDIDDVIVVDVEVIAGMTRKYIRLNNYYRYIKYIT